MSTTPRLPMEGSRSMFVGRPELDERFRTLYGTMWTEGVVDHPTKELVRIRNARVTDCGF